MNFCNLDNFLRDSQIRPERPPRCSDRERPPARSASLQRFLIPSRLVCTRSVYGTMGQGSRQNETATKSYCCLRHVVFVDFSVISLHVAWFTCRKFSCPGFCWQISYQFGVSWNASQARILWAYRMQLSSFCQTARTSNTINHESWLITWIVLRRRTPHCKPPTGSFCRRHEHWPSVPSKGSNEKIGSFAR